MAAAGQWLCINSNLAPRHPMQAKEAKQSKQSKPCHLMPAGHHRPNQHRVNGGPDDGSPRSTRLFKIRRAVPRLEAPNRVGEQANSWSAGAPSSRQSLPHTPGRSVASRAPSRLWCRDHCGSIRFIHCKPDVACWSLAKKPKDAGGIGASMPAGTILHRTAHAFPLRISATQPNPFTHLLCLVSKY